MTTPPEHAAAEKRGSNTRDHRVRNIHPCLFFVARMSKRLVGAVDEYDGDRFFTRLGGKGKTVATPLLLCLVCIELSDFVFAVDSIPAVLGISQV